MDPAWQIALIHQVAGQVPGSLRQVLLVINAPPNGRGLAFHFLGRGGIALTFIYEGEVVERLGQADLGSIPAEDSLCLLHEKDGLGNIGLNYRLSTREQSPAFVLPIPGCS